MPVVAAPAWERYAAGTEEPYFAEWCEESLLQSEDRWAGQPLVLEQFQRQLLAEALAVDEHERRVWDRVIIVMPRKNGKTALLAAYAIYSLYHDQGNPEILLAAASEKQANKLFKFCANYVRQSRELSEVFRVRDHAGEIVREDGRGVIMRMASDARRLHGYGPSLVVGDELGQWTTPQLEDAWDALTSGSGARQDPQVFAITTAGKAHERHSSILGLLLEQARAAEDREEQPGLMIARLWDAKTLVYEFAADTEDPEDIEAIKLANPAPWITEEFLRKQSKSLRRAAFLQLHACVWAEREDAWLPAGAWEALAEPREVPEGTTIVLGFDGSYRNDSTALVGCTCEAEPYVWVEGIWERPEGRDDWVVPRGEVEAAVEAALGRWQVAELACDPPGWHREIEEWGERYGRTVTVMFPTNRSSMMEDACSQFYTAVVNGKLSQDGSNTLARHLANAVVKETRSGVYITKDHQDSPRKIDAAVAAVIAFARAQSHSGRSYIADIGAIMEELDGEEPEDEEW